MDGRSALRGAFPGDGGWGPAPAFAWMMTWT